MHPLVADGSHHPDSALATRGPCANGPPPPRPTLVSIRNVQPAAAQGFHAVGTTSQVRRASHRLHPRPQEAAQAEPLLRIHSAMLHACRAHLEEDAGKNVHGGNGDGRHSLVDLNRAGVPLLEIVTEPDFASGAEAAAYGAELRRIVRFLGISDGNMQVPPSHPGTPPQKSPPFSSR